MAINDNKIVAPVTITDPYNLLGIYPANGVFDVADIVALERPSSQGGIPGRINKWSRHKPVRYPQAAPLSDNYPQQSGGVTTYIDQWEGSGTDKNTGIRYGLQATIPHGTSIVAIHDTTFDYVAYPHPGTDYCRLSDFDGYDHNARPNLTGSQITEISADYAYLNIIINYYDSKINPTGIPIDSWLALASDKSIGDYYPAVLVTDENGSSFARLLTNGETNTITTLRVKGTSMGDVWYSLFKVKFFNDQTSSSNPPAGQSDTFPGDISIGSNLKITLFVIDRKSFEYWAGVDKVITLGDYFPIPTSIAMNVRVTSVHTAIKISNLSINLLTLDFIISVNFPDGFPQIGEKYTFRISGGEFFAAYDYEYNGDTMAPLILVSPITRPTTPGTRIYQITCTVYGVNQSGGVGIKLDSITKSMTITIPESGIL